MYGSDERRQPREGEIGPAIAAGVIEGKRQAVRLLIAVRFGAVPEGLERRIADAGASELSDLLRQAGTTSAEAL